MQSLLVRFLRSLDRSRRRQKHFAVSVLILMVSFGASIAIYSIVEPVVLRPLPYPHDDELVKISEPRRGDAFRLSAASTQSFSDWNRLHGGIFRSIAAIGGSRFEPADADLVEVSVNGVSASIFETLGIHPQIGHEFGPENQQEGAHRVVAISNAMWKRRFGGSETVLGHTFRGTDGDWTIVAVLPKGAGYPIAKDGIEFMWTPLVLGPAQTTRAATAHVYDIDVVARLAAGVSLRKAQEGMESIVGTLAQQFPNWFAQNEWVDVRPLRQALVGNAGQPMLLLLWAVTVVQVLAVINVASLVALSTSSRAREFAIRIALGESRWQLFFKLALENLWLCVSGALLGLLLAISLVRSMIGLLPSNLFRATTIGVNYRSWLLAGLLAISTSVLVAALPAWRTSRCQLSTAFNGNFGFDPRVIGRLLRGMLGVQLAFAIFLTVCTAMLLVSITRVYRLDLGFDYRPVVSITARAKPAAMAAGPRQPFSVSLNSALERLAALGDVEQMAEMTGGSAPFTSGRSRTTLSRSDIEGLPAKYQAEVKSVSAGYFETMKIRFLRGTTFEAGSGDSLVINDLAASLLFGTSDAIGQRVLAGNSGVKTIVGVVAAARYRGAEGDTAPEAYLPANLEKASSCTIYLRIRNADFRSGVYSQAIGSTGDLQPGEEKILTTSLARVIQPRRLNTTTAVVLGFVAVLVAAIGVYSVMSYQVVQQSKAIAIRVALGATPWRIATEVASQAGVFLGAGATLGCAMAILCFRYLRPLLFEVHAEDIGIYGATVCLVVAVSMLACGIPARRAANSSPASAIK